MKKLPLILTLLTTLTISGVYAAWIYGNDLLPPVENDYKPVINGSGENITKGVINVSTDNINLLIDDKGDYTPILTISGSVSINFTPDAQAEEFVKQNGIKLKYTVKVSDNYQFDSDGVNGVDRDILIVNQELATGYTDTYVSNVTIDSEFFLNCLTLNIPEGFKIDTKEKFEKFKSEISVPGAITLEVSEYLE